MASFRLASDHGSGVDHTVTLSDGISLSYKIFGQNVAGCIPILAIHGWQDNSNSFIPLAAQLQGSQSTQIKSAAGSLAKVYSSDFHSNSEEKLLSKGRNEISPAKLCIVAVDLVGHGQSSHLSPQGYYIYGKYVLHMAELTQKHLRWTNFHIIAHSMGSSIGTMLAAAKPEQVLSLTFLDAIGLWVHDADIGANYIKTYIDKLSKEQKPVNRRLFSSKDEAARKYMKNRAIDWNSARLLVDRGVESVNFTDKTTGQIVEKYQFAHDRRLNDEPIMFFTEELAVGLYKQLHCPVLFIFGDRKASKSLQKHNSGGEGDNSERNKEESDKTKDSADNAGGFAASKDGKYLADKARGRLLVINDSVCYIAQGNHHLHMDNPSQIVYPVLQHLSYAINKPKTTDIKASL
jgi:pimeloyl-ACP methyl ester carboxylesterase